MISCHEELTPLTYTIKKQWEAEQREYAEVQENVSWNNKANIVV